MMSDDLRERVLAALATAPDHGGWRAGMDADDYAPLADTALAVVAEWLAGQAALVVKVLLDEGAAPGDDLHSWRCSYPERYGPCTCVGDVAQEILDALRAMVQPESGPGVAETGQGEPEGAAVGDRTSGDALGAQNDNGVVWGEGS